MTKLKKIINSEIRGSVNENHYSFTSGDCDIYAVSLHRLYGYPLYVIRGYYPDEDFDNEEYYEDAHVMIKLPNGKFFDSQGEQTKEELLQLAMFSNNVKRIEIIPVDEQEALEAFSCQDQEADIKNVMNQIKNIKN